MKRVVLHCCVFLISVGAMALVLIPLGGCSPDDPMLAGAIESPEGLVVDGPSDAPIEPVTAASGTGPLYINEFMASNVSTIRDPNNELDDWVEIYNADPNNSIDVGGMYLTDDLANPTKCQIPATDPSKTTIPPHGVLLFWFDGQPAQGVLHINTKLSKSGEQLGLFAADGTTQIDSLTFGPQADDVSFGRQPDGGVNWVYFDMAYATPGTANSALPPAGEPVFSSVGGLYTGTVVLSLSVPSAPPGTHIYYTLDGSEPTNGPSSTGYDYMFQETRNGANEAGTGPTETRYHVTYEYTAPITISSTTVVRARVYATNYMPSNIVTHTYIVNLTNPSNLPVVCVSSPPRYLWSNDKDSIMGGILVMGPPPYGDMWYDQSNLMMDEWNRPGHVEFYEPNGVRAFSQEIEIRSGGSSTQLGPQKPMVLYAVGGERFNYQVFPDLDIDSFRILVLHMSGDDWPYTQFRDAMVHGLLRDTDIDRQAYRPAIVYVNGQYYGCMSIRERRNKDYVASHHNIDANALDMLDNYGYDQVSKTFFGDGEINEGDDLHYKAMINECFLNPDTTPKDLTQPANYAAIKQRMEVDNFLDYWVSEVCVSNVDWPGGNIRIWRPRVDNGRWRWTLVDTDYSFNLPALNSAAYSTGVNYNMINHVTNDYSTSWYNHRATTYIFRRLVTNAEFKSEFIRRVADHLNVTFDPTRVKTDIDAKKAGISPEFTRAGGQIDRWKNDRNPWVYTHSSMQYPSYWMVPIGEPSTPSWPTWDASVQRLRDFADAHPAVLRNQVNTKWGLGGTATVTFNVSPAGAGKIKVNRLVLPIPSTGTWTGTYFKTISNQVAAIPSRGYRFQGWTGITGSSVATVTPTGNMTITATFVADAANNNSIVINEINYRSNPDFTPGNWVEFHNPHDFTVDVSGWQFKDAENDNVFAFPPHTTIGPNQYLVVCENRTSFHSVFPLVENCIGNFTFNLSNEGEILRLYDTGGNLIDSLTYDDEFPWPTEPDGTGPTLELKNPGVDNAICGAWAASAGHGTPGSVNSAFIPAPQVSTWAIGGPNGLGSEAWTTINNGYVEPRSYGVQKLRVTFDRAMDTSITDPNSFQIVGLSNGDVSSLVSTVTWDSATQATVVLMSPLPDADTYTMTVGSSLQSAAGCPLGGDRDISVSALVSDLNGNHSVGFEDYLVLSQNYGASNVGWAAGDLNADGTVNFSDYLALSSSYGKTDGQ